jgi:hypothetical protein
MVVANKCFVILLSVLRNIFILFIFCQPCMAQDSLDSNEIKKKRLNTFVITSSTAYAASMTGLYQLWYKDSKHQSFRFFNDNAEWKQVDKAGHLFSSFYLSYGAQHCLRWSGLENKKATLISSATAFLMLVPIEVFDGFSDAYGASKGDLIADAGGAALFYGQQSLWSEVRIYPKFSFHPTSYAALRPAVLGDHAVSELFKDYNGQTYWLSFDMDKFMRFPKWLNVAVGYGAEDMVFARDAQNYQAGYNPYRQFYFSLDLDLTALKTRSKVLKTLIFMANMIRIPAPSISFSTKGTKFHALYF